LGRKRRLLKGLPEWRTVFTYAPDFSELGNRVKRALTEGKIRFKIEWDKIIGVFSIRVLASEFEKAVKAINQELGLEI